MKGRKKTSYPVTAEEEDIGGKKSQKVSLKGDLWESVIMILG